MIRAVTILLVYQLIGETLVMALNVPIPGPVMGMVFLFVTLLIRKSVPDDVKTTAQGLMRVIEGLPAFGVCFMMLLGIWYAHYLFFRRYGLEDGVIMVLNGILLFVVDVLHLSA